MANEGLQRLQQKKREDSIERVKWAIQYLQDLEGTHCRISAAKIAEISELSRAALYKPHLRPLWDPRWLESEEERQRQRESVHREQEKQQMEEKISRLEKQLDKRGIQIARLTKGLEKEKNRSTVYRQDYEELKERQQKLLHFNLRLLRKLHIHGIDTSEFTE